MLSDISSKNRCIRIFSSYYSVKNWTGTQISKDVAKSLFDDISKITNPVNTIWGYLANLILCRRAQIFITDDLHTLNDPIGLIRELNDLLREHNQEKQTKIYLWFISRPLPEFAKKISLLECFKKEMLISIDYENCFANLICAFVKHNNLNHNINAVIKHFNNLCPNDLLLLHLALKIWKKKNDISKTHWSKIDREILRKEYRQILSIRIGKSIREQNKSIHYSSEEKIFYQILSSLFKIAVIQTYFDNMIGCDDLYNEFNSDLQKFYSVLGLIVEKSFILPIRYKFPHSHLAKWFWELIVTAPQGEEFYVGWKEISKDIREYLIRENISILEGSYEDFPLNIRLDYPRELQQTLKFVIPWLWCELIKDSNEYRSLYSIIEDYYKPIQFFSDYSKFLTVTHEGNIQGLNLSLLDIKLFLLTPQIQEKEGYEFPFHKPDHYTLYSFSYYFRNSLIKDPDKKLMKALSPKICNLRKLEYLDLAKNELKDLPIELKENKILKLLDLTGNSLNHIPDSIFNLNELRTLYLDENKIKKIPKSINRLKNLKELTISHNNLKKMPKEIGNLNDLEYLSLAHNSLEEIPPRIKNLKKLSLLVLEHNELAHLPPEIGNLDNLTFLSLNGNSQIKIPPKEFQNLKNLITLILDESYKENEDWNKILSRMEIDEIGYGEYFCNVY